MNESTVGDSRPSAAVDDFHERRDRIRREMGGAPRITRTHERGRRTARERISAIADGESFVEIGTFTTSARPDQRGTTPGDGLIGGHARVAGRPVTVAADDPTVRMATSAETNQVRFHRLLRAAMRHGNPFVFLAERGGGRLPDILGAEGFMRQATPDTDSPQLLRARSVPMVTAVLGDSFGQATILASASDFVVQVRGTVMALTSGRVSAVATGEVIDDEAVGGAEVNHRETGRVDAIVDSEDEALELVKRFLSFLPSSSGERPTRGPSAGSRRATSLAALVPDNPRRVYDVRRLLRELVDEGDLLECRSGYARSVVCALARIDGHAVALVANQPQVEAGVLTPNAVEKVVRHLCLAEAFNLPVVYVVDTPGFVIGPRVEHDRLVQRATMLMQASAMLTTPTICLVTRKAFGLAFAALGGSTRSSEAVLAWPSAEIGFMSPAVAANVLHGAELDDLPPEERQSRLAELRDRYSWGSGPYDAAAAMHIDEVIAPDETVPVLSELLARETAAPVRARGERPLLTWPVAW